MATSKLQKIPFLDYKYCKIPEGSSESSVTFPAFVNMFMIVAVNGSGLTDIVAGRSLAVPVKCVDNNVIKSVVMNNDRSVTVTTNFSSTLGYITW